jgi:hypothetical protein
MVTIGKNKYLSCGRDGGTGDIMCNVKDFKGNDIDQFGMTIGALMMETAPPAFKDVVIEDESFIVPHNEHAFTHLDTTFMPSKPHECKVIDIKDDDGDIMDRILHCKKKPPRRKKKTTAK